LLQLLINAPTSHGRLSHGGDQRQAGLRGAARVVTPKR
jgi:hypothetical protein